MSRDKIASSEKIARAIMTPEWDEKLNRISPSAFSGERVSVNRLSIFPLFLTSEIFHRDFNQPPRDVAFAAVISVSALQQAGREFEHKSTSLSVVPAATDTNESHAEIVPKVTRGLANKIISKLEQRYLLPPSRIAWAGVRLQRVVLWIWRKYALAVYHIRCRSLASTSE